MSRSLKLSDIAQSVMELEVIDLALNPDDYGLYEDERISYTTLLDHLSADLSRLRIPATVQERYIVADLLTDLSNGHDDDIESGRSDDIAYSRRATRSLGTLASKVRKG